MSPRPDRRISTRELVPLIAGWNAGRGAGYAALALRLRQLVLDGRLPVHVVLPSERELAAALGTSRTTTAAAYRALRDAGFAAAGQGAGTWTALPGGDPAPETAPWPVHPSAHPGPADGRGDFASAAPEAPPQVPAAYAAALAELPIYLPGHGYVTAGLPALRERVADRFAARGAPTSADEVVVTSGAAHGLRLVLDTILAPGDRVVVESPSYPLALDAIRRAGGRPVPVPIEDAGWDVASFAEAARATGARAAYLMPDFHNPTGRLMDAGTRAELAGALARAGCTAVVDETTADLDLRGPDAAAAPPPFAAFARPGAVVTLGSTSKTFWGGLRVGWVRTDARLVRRLILRRATEDLGSPLRRAARHRPPAERRRRRAPRPQAHPRPASGGSGRSRRTRAAGVVRAPAARRTRSLVPAADAVEHGVRRGRPVGGRRGDAGPEVRRGPRVRGAAEAALLATAAGAGGSGRATGTGVGRRDVGARRRG